ncbi:MAG TPA: TPM domain-containing protein [Candidatus Nanoarchaeia archaeon]|nr:TPM domain-containing protein [Candidatus Nanoarchaeia archaeon]
MKRIALYIILAAALVTSAHALSFVNDDVGVLSAQETSELTGILQSMYDSGSAQYAVVIVKSLEGRDIEGYAFELAENTLGSKEKNNGLVLLVAIDDRAYRFEVGRGLEPVLPDILAGRIGRDYLMPYLKEGKYGQGIIEASKAVRATIMGDSASEYYVVPNARSNALSPFVSLLALLFFFMVIGFVFSRGRRHRSDDSYFLAGMMLGGMMRRGPGGFGGRPGFGGGSFGGGGASGGW